METVHDSEANLPIPDEVIDGPVIIDVQLPEASTAVQAISNEISSRKPTPEERLASGAWLRTKHVAELFGVSERAVTDWAMKGLIPSVRTPGGHRRYNEEDILRIRDAATTGGPILPDTRL